MGMKETFYNAFGQLSPFRKKEKNILILLIFFSVFIRIPVIFLFGDTNLDNEWKIIVGNLVEHQQFSLRRFDKFFLPNLTMPPFYALYLYFFSIFNLDQSNYVLLVLASHTLLSGISVALFYKINKIFFSQKISFYSSLFFSLFPLHLYACGQISSITLQIFFLILFFYFFFQFVEKKNILSIILFSLVTGLLILLRAEFILIFILSLFYLLIFLKASIKNILLIFLITLITISPYLIRNILIFEKITITKTFGYNLWKGNNPNAKVEGSGLIEKNLQNQIEKIPKDKFYQFNFDKIFLDRAIENITMEPKKYLILFVRKMASFLLIDIESTYQNYYHPLHYLPVLLLGITSLIGIIFSDKKSYRLNYLILIFFFNVIIFSSFFILPRYSLVILPLQIIFTNILIQYLRDKFFHRY